MSIHCKSILKHALTVGLFDSTTADMRFIEMYSIKTRNCLPLITVEHRRLTDSIPIYMNHPPEKLERSHKFRHGGFFASPKDLGKH
eukprot:g65199.t1